LHDPKRGTVWMTCWRGETKLTFCENFAKIWIEKAQSQNVTGTPVGQEYADDDQATPQ
jgi:hypothetical protein